MEDFENCYYSLDCSISENKSDEHVKLLRNSSNPIIHQQSNERWLALALFCALSCIQCCIWNTWTPIADSSIKAFPSWKLSHVGLLSNWGCITYLTCCIPCCWLLHKKGLVLPLRLAAILSTIAAFIRCLSSEEWAFTIESHVAAVLNGISGVIIGPATAFVSASWFTSGERSTATGLSSAFNQLGMALSYYIGPAVVGTPFLNTSVIVTNHQAYESNQTEKLKIAMAERGLTTNDSALHSADLRVQIMSLMRIEFVAQLLVLFGFVCFFPKIRNASAESTGKTVELRFHESILRLLKNKDMWLLCTSGALSQGATGPWFVMITMAFGNAITQEEADKLALWTILVGSVLSLAASRIVDVFQGHHKVAIYLLLAISSAMFLWVLLLDNRVLVFHKNELYLAVLLGISASWSTPALYLELASEISFPVSEAIVGGYLIFLGNVIGMIFYFFYFIPSLGEHWSSYCVFISLTISSIMIVYVKDEYVRTQIYLSEVSKQDLHHMTDAERLWILRESRGQDTHFKKHLREEETHSEADDLSDFT